VAEVERLRYLVVRLADNDELRDSRLGLGQPVRRP
jgi:hypothetical protein